jgi:predicted ArsR family transcriptional regulator
MHSTKTEILSLLKRIDGSTVDELASALKLAPMTVRQHLTALERDALVVAVEVRRATGRPHYLYRLTGDGHRHVLDGHDRMLALLVEQVGACEAAAFTAMPPQHRRAELFSLAAAALAARHRSEVKALRGTGRIDRAVAILRTHGGFAEWQHAADGAVELRDYGCAYRATVGADGPCAWHETFLSALLDVEIRTADAPADCAACCRYLIPQPVALRGEASPAAAATFRGTHS